MVEDLISIYHNENNEKNISDEIFKSLRSAIESKILKEDILLYNIKIPSFIQEIKNKIKGNKTGLEFNRKLAKEVLLNKEINYVENFLEKLETIGDIDKLISLFQNEILYYKKEIEFIENNIEIKSDLTKKEIIYINKFFQKNLNKESQDLLMMVYADSGNELYEALVSDIPRFKPSIYIKKNLLMKFIEEINSYLEIDIEKINLIQHLNNKELLRF